MAEPLSKQESAYRQIRARILSGAYGPGYRLVVSRLAAELGLSPIPVREAVRRLEAEGLVQYHRNTGATVSPADPTVYVEALTVLAVLEGYATRLAAPHLRSPDLQRLRAIAAQMAEALAAPDLQRFGDLNRAFHFTIYARCPNRYLVETITQTWQRLDNVRRTQLALLPGRGRESLAEHQALIQALAAGAAGESGDAAGKPAGAADRPAGAGGQAATVGGADPAGAVEALARAHKLRTVHAFLDWQQGLPPVAQPPLNPTPDKE